MLGYDPPYEATDGGRSIRVPRVASSSLQGPARAPGTPGKRRRAGPAETDPDAVPALAAAVGGLLITCSALRASYNRRIRDLEDEIVRLTIAADRDHLTGLGNRRSFERSLACEWRRALRHGSHFTLALIDVDHFKLFNDTYGHPAGDLALKGVAGCLAGTLERPGDGAFRVGGEEFVLILPDTDEAGAGVIGLQVRQALQRAALPHGLSPTGFITASVGACTTIARDGEQPGTLLTLADEALYEAKRAGRDRAVCVRPRPPAAAPVVPRHRGDADAGTPMRGRAGAGQR